MIAVILLVMMTALVAVLGLVIDIGLVLGMHRRVHNAADTAATAAANDLLFGKSLSQATATATTFVQQHNGLAGATVTINVPPTSGPHQSNNYVEAIIALQMPTTFMRVVGINQTPVRARAVAGSENVASGEGVLVMDPLAWPGLDVSGGGILSVLGDVTVNSTGGGVDENGDPSLTDLAGNQQWAARGGQPNSNTGLFATRVSVVGGVDDPDNFKNVDPQDASNPLLANQSPMPDPLAFLPTPWVANGVDPTARGDVSISNGGFSPSTLPVDADGAVLLSPGVYGSLRITGGAAILEPGIYVLTGGNNNALNITGGAVQAEGVMFYNTGSNYDPLTGLPDINDPPDPLNQSRPPRANQQSGVDYGDVTINAAMTFKPIDVDQYSYSSADIDIFNGMLFYQRRWNPVGVELQGNASDGYLGGTMYGKWVNFRIAGQGVYDAQFMVGSITVPGQGNVTLEFSGEKKGRAPQIFLVE